jgi:hypothetical protein
MEKQNLRSEHQHLPALADAIRRNYGCQARHVESVQVTETFQGRILWHGTVEVFALVGHPTAKRCYAWGYWLGGGSERVVAVLEEPPVDSAVTAVRAALVSGSRQGI